MIHIKTIPYSLKFKRPFKIAHGTRIYTDAVFVRLQWESFTGYGEATLPPYLKETIETVTDFFSSLELTHLPERANIPAILEQIDQADENNFSAKAAASMALFDLIGRIENVSIANLLNLEAKPVSTSYTIGMGTEKDLEEELANGIQAQYIKVKLGGKNDIEWVKSIRKYTELPGWVDVNQGWYEQTFGLEMAHMLKENNFLFIEQPFPTHQPQLTEWLTQRSPLPIFADESCQRPEDMDGMNNLFDGVNIKLMKAGGLHQAVKMIEMAREKDLNVLIGGMAESSCAAACAFHIGSLADFIDLDGPLLINNDPFRGLNYDNGILNIRDNEGSGVVPESLFN